MKFGFDWPSGLRGEDIWTLWTTATAKTDDGAWVYLSSPC